MFFVVVNLDASVLSFRVLSFAIIALLCTSHTHVQCTLMMMMLACGPNLQPQCQNSRIRCKSTNLCKLENYQSGLLDADPMNVVRGGIFLRSSPPLAVLFFCA